MFDNFELCPFGTTLECRLKYHQLFQSSFDSIPGLFVNRKLTWTTDNGVNWAILATAVQFHLVELDLLWDLGKLGSDRFPIWSAPAFYSVHQEVREAINNQKGTKLWTFPYPPPPLHLRTLRGGCFIVKLVALS